MKKCTKCKIDKSYEDFQTEKRKTDGVTSRCKICLNEDKKYYLDQKRDQIRKYNRKKYYENHEENKKSRTEKSKKLREENSEWISAYKKEWWKKHATRLRKKQNELRKLPEFKKKRNEYLKERLCKNELPKIRARKIFRAAVKTGFLVRPNHCSKCMKECKPDGHHDDYNKPLEVRWLCKVCHNHEHKKLLDIKP